MRITDLSYVETVETTHVKGGLGNFFSTQINFSAIGQSSNANAGNFAGISVLNLAASANNATVTQVNI
ncbi:hypothetical protein ACN4EK_21560 [Pantanalinema rosaneae CENA516]|uniref:hypothetical protein n=1 Tax=Pantanalinema rosaneae TaxID=1620701 RepID=UPI003D6EBECD